MLGGAGERVRCFALFGVRALIPKPRGAMAISWTAWALGWEAGAGLG